jgi:hypothetical protein
LSNFVIGLLLENDPIEPGAGRDVTQARASAMGFLSRQENRISTDACRARQLKVAPSTNPHQEQNREDNASVNVVCGEKIAN